MTDSIRPTLHAVAAVVSVVMLVAALSALAVVRADQRDPELIAGGGEGGFAAGSGDGGSGATFDDDDFDVDDTEAGGGATANGSAANGAARDGRSRATGTGGSQQSTSGGAGGGGGGQDQQQSAANGGGGGGGQCADYNPDEGVYCDRWLVGGTTVLSGPLAIYGEQGLRGGQAWIEHLRRNIAPREGIRPAQLIYYDDGLDPNRTLQFTQRLVEVDKVLLIGGVTSPEAIAEYLDAKQVPMIGDIGLSPRSYAADMIFPTAAPYEVRSDLRIAIADREFGIESIAVIQEFLPGISKEPIINGWRDAAEKHGVELVYENYDLSSEDNDCRGAMLSALRAQPDFIMLPVAAPPMLACMREAAAQRARPGQPPYQFLKGWGGGSNLQFEVDQCGSQCHGMFSAGTPFLDPRTNPHPHAKAYIENMAKYAPGIDVTGFITINYYHAGLLQYELMKQAGILHDLSRANVIRAAKRFGPFETGFGNTVTWRDTIPRIPSTCGYNVVLDPEQNRWVFGTEEICV